MGPRSRSSPASSSLFNASIGVSVGVGGERGHHRRSGHDRTADRLHGKRRYAQSRSVEGNRARQHDECVGPSQLPPRVRRLDLERSRSRGVRLAHHRRVHDAQQQRARPLGLERRPSGRDRQHLQRQRLAADPRRRGLVSLGAVGECLFVERDRRHPHQRRNERSLRHAVRRRHPLRDQLDDQRSRSVRPHADGPRRRRGETRNQRRHRDRRLVDAGSDRRPGDPGAAGPLHLGVRDAGGG